MSHTDEVITRVTHYLRDIYYIPKYSFISTPNGKYRLFHNLNKSNSSISGIL